MIRTFSPHYRDDNIHLPLLEHLVIVKLHCFNRRERGERRDLIKTYFLFSALFATSAVNINLTITFFIVILTDM
jgi:hypothetical protein